MVHWNSSPHPISDIRDWSEAGRLELRPDFQRREVWSAAARVMLMDTILRDVPMPKIFLANTIREGKTYRVVIDGQQRISAILAFLRNKYSLDEPYPGDYVGKTFSELEQTVQDNFLSYQIDFNEAINPTDAEVREVYARVNKYTVPLNKQELRRADLPGDFLNMSEKLAINEYFDEAGIFTPANRRRYADVEFVSELLAAMISGIQDKKATLDEFYIKYSKWKGSSQKKIRSDFIAVLKELETIFDDSLDIKKTRFRQKADFYSLFLVIYRFISEGKSLGEKALGWLREDLEILQAHIRPESEIPICSEYAIKCVSQANSASSRRWRFEFLKRILSGTYTGELPDKEGAIVFYRLLDEICVGDAGGFCPQPVFECPVCEKEISGQFDNCTLAWSKAEVAVQLSNSIWMHTSCVTAQSDWLVLERPKDDSTDLF